MTVDVDDDLHRMARLVPHYSGPQNSDQAIKLKIRRRERGRGDDDDAKAEQSKVQGARGD